jgi:Predicted transcriptional regulators
MFSMIETGRRIGRLRKNNNLTQMELADLMGVSYQAVSNWERGVSMPDISKLPELAKIFNVKIDDLFNQEES